MLFEKLKHHIDCPIILEEAKVRGLFKGLEGHIIAQSAEFC